VLIFSVDLWLLSGEKRNLPGWAAEGRFRPKAEIFSFWKRTSQPDHKSLDNVTPADVYNGRRNDILDRRSMIKVRTLTQRKVQNLRLAG
jgi:hypothetical protein